MDKHTNKQEEEMDRHTNDQEEELVNILKSAFLNYGGSRGSQPNECKDLGVGV